VDTLVTHVYVAEDDPRYQVGPPIGPRPRNPTNMTKAIAALLRLAGALRPQA